MIERPIIMHGFSVRLILSGHKSMTRRLVKAPRWAVNDTVTLGSHDPWPMARAASGRLVAVPCPFGVPGHVLWVREAAYITPPNFGDADLHTHRDPEGHGRMVGYAASMSGDAARCARDYGVRKTSPLHFPRWAARLRLKVTNVRAEQLRAIEHCDADALAEGVTNVPDGVGPHYAAPGASTATSRTAWGAFAKAWELIHGKGAWARDPLVWVVRFERIEDP